MTRLPSEIVDGTEVGRDMAIALRGPLLSKLAPKAEPAAPLADSEMLAFLLTTP